MANTLSVWCKEAKKALIDKDMTATELAKSLGFTPAYISMLLNGNHYSETAIKKICVALDIEEPKGNTISIS